MRYWSGRHNGWKLMWLDRRVVLELNPRNRWGVGVAAHRIQWAGGDSWRAVAHLGPLHLYWQSKA